MLAAGKPFGDRIACGFGTCQPISGELPDCFYPSDVHARIAVATTLFTGESHWHSIVIRVLEMEITLKCRPRS